MTLVDKKLTIREEILSFYNDDRGMVASAIQRKAARLEKERNESAVFESKRRLAFALCRDILADVWELEADGIREYDDKAIYTSIVTSAEGAESWGLIIPSTGDILSVYTHAEKPCHFVWTQDRKIVRETVVMHTDGSCMTERDIIRIVMDIIIEFMDNFIEHHGIH